MVSRPLIVAVATPPGQGGVGIVRLSGTQDAIEMVAKSLLGRCPVPRYAWYTGFLDEQGEVLDQGIALYFPAPHSFTGEHVLELQGHGGPAILELILRRCVQCGARLAEPGEFSQRAFLNGKIDLAQAEAIADMISATTAQAARAATRSLTGAFSTAVHDLVRQVIELRTLVEALIDFPDEELDFLTRYPIREPLAGVLVSLQQLLKKVHAGTWLQRGVNVVLLGAPNVGKSSLLNSLAGDDVAIVTPIAGTTRDPIRHVLQIQGIPVRLVDTAGLRSTDDTVERLGIERSWKEAQQADIVVLMQACDDPASAVELEAWSKQLPPEIPRVWVYNKIDTIHERPRREMSTDLSTEIGTEKSSRVYISARTHEGLEHLEAAVLELLQVELNPSEDTFLARSRHLDALRLAHLHLDEAAALWDVHLDCSAPVPLELLAESLREAQNALNSITGVFTADDLLGVIFGSFCIGK